MATRKDDLWAQMSYTYSGVCPQKYTGWSLQYLRKSKGLKVTDSCSQMLLLQEASNCSEMGIVDVCQDEQ